MALVLAAALVLAGCKQDPDPSTRQETQLEKAIRDLAGTTGHRSLTTDEPLTNDDLTYVGKAIKNLPNTVTVELDLSRATGITSIVPSAFNRCWKLTSITLPDTVTSIADLAFAYCYALDSVTFANNTSTWTVTETSEYYSEKKYSGISVKDPTTNAKNLRGTYYSYKWTKE